MVGAILSLAAGCASCQREVCSAETCSGCCDAAGVCQAAADVACGTGGATCVVCGSEERCRSGKCAAAMSDGGTPPGSYPAFLDEYARVFCEREARCGRVPPASAACVQLRRNFLGHRGTTPNARPISERSVALGASSYDPVEALACLTAISRLHCGYFGADLEAPPCVAVTTAAADAGGVCHSNPDCTATGEVCSGASCSRRCSTGGALNDSCRADGRCASGQCVDGVCRAVAPGAACLSSLDCGPTAFCSPSSGCVTRPPVGAPCPDGTCASGARCANGTCVAQLDVGAQCMIAVECLSFVCTQGRCAAPLPDGQVCARSDECVSQRCAQTRCSPRVPVGQQCDPALDECEFGLTCDPLTFRCGPFRRIQTGQPCSVGRSICRWSAEVCRRVEDSTLTGTCGTPQRGDVCNNAQAFCGFGLTCRAGRCEPGVEQAACDSTRNCQEPLVCIQNRCTRKVATGELCTSASGLDNPCSSNLDICLTIPPETQARCRKALVLGEPCTAGCAWPWQCLSGVCAATGRPGQPCIDNRCLEGGCLLPDAGLVVRFGAGTCAAPTGDGSACWSNSGCASGHCDRVGALPGTCVSTCN